MHHRRLLRVIPALFLTLLLVAVTTPPALSQASAPAPGRSGLYRLTPESQFVEGCFDPCLCVVQYHEALFGTVRLTPAGPAPAPGPDFTIYNVTDLSWRVDRFDYWVTGAGTYRIGGQPLMHQLTLDLKVGDRDVEHYDSGLTPVGSNDGTIAIGISKNNLVCHDTVFNLSMRPLLAQEIAPYALRQSLYKEGCWDLCECAIRSWPFLGRFGLVRLTGPGPIAPANAPGEFGVVDLRGVVLDGLSPAANAGTPVHGGGLYEVDAVTGTQRLRLALVEDGAGPTRFDSGAVAWGGDLKRIRAEVAENGFACYDRVYSIDARRRPRSDLATQAIRTDPYLPGVVPAP